MSNNDSFQFSDITNPYTPVRDAIFKLVLKL